MDDAFAWPQADHLLRVAVRLLAATVLGGLIGLEREQTGKAAGLRTHMLVALGSALFTLAPREAGMPLANISAVVQGVVTGIGFVGAGAILKSSSEERVVGLTTATTVWLTAAVGVAAALGPLWVPTLAVLTGLVVLTALRRFQSRLDDDTRLPLD
jgi:putative Mg2+ transporter-C (MgtC) family protein